MIKKFYEKIKKFYGTNEKEILFILIILFFFIPYFFLDYFTSTKEANLIGIIVDEIIPFVPGFVFVYLSTYFFWMMPYFLIENKKYFRKVVFVYLGVLFFSYLVFLIYPVQMVRPTVRGEGFLEGLVNWLYGVDGGGYNCFPSIHVAISFLGGMACFRYDKKYWWLLVWGGLIIISTLLVKQHYFLDVVGGLVVGAVGYGIFNKINSGELSSGEINPGKFNQRKKEKRKVKR